MASSSHADRDRRDEPHSSRRREREHRDDREHRRKRDDGSASPGPSRPRSRSPESRRKTSNRDHDAGAQEEKAQRAQALPHGAPTLDEEAHYYSHAREFRAWLRVARGIRYLDELASSGEQRRYFAKFVRRWNDGSLDGECR